ncbi:MAG: Glycosyl transferase family 2 [Candidatus Collierbacteria bacterium GW2011_GWB1_44_6]|uniref:Glycosyl transferase family 2 n=2 Tax=Candidatus Collieribacteriota TaxID=1752725 RepID=A0A0G1JQT1_9BACT|nr:MAG: Glycosyl transferase family 2 [Candidatus Collierbacteria bacterium GW2011_GWC2_43_12]KKT73780.1 MAG: Glycosyl transferase family 2 [Candidatus Collierbacteria bacterium GW2011_GWB1_44_6]KKT83757.1 MAG: Glycosyl transferase family 2 [Microgenomates group bacterium GW2011_GWC1_44_9]
MKTKRQTISVTLATYNEEANIAACLESVKDFADEIVVVDGYSTDNTAEIAKKLGVKVILRPNNPVFHVQKDIANRSAKSDWILQMDADERVTKEMVKEILGILEGSYFGYDSWISPLKSSINKIIKIFSEPQLLRSPASAYYLPRKNFFLNRYLENAGQYPDPVIRLFQRGKARLPAKDVHEQMIVKGVTGWLMSDLDHLATPNFSRYLLRENSYSSLHAHQLKDAGVKVNLFNTLNYLFFKPLGTFLSLYFRYRGFLDGFPGFVFSLYSGLHHAFSYMKLWEIYKDEEYK